MPLYIRDDEVEALAIKLKALTGARTKTDAVKAALLHELKRFGERAPLLERLSRSGPWLMRLVRWLTTSI